MNDFVAPVPATPRDVRMGDAWVLGNVVVMIGVPHPTARALFTLRPLCDLDGQGILLRAGDPASVARGRGIIAGWEARTGQQATLFLRMALPTPDLLPT